MGGPSSIPPRFLPQKVERVYINLGRTGDAIASVPLCWLYWKETGKKAALMVAREFAPFLEGISYIKPEIWPGDWRDVLGARARCRMLGYEEIMMAQVYGYGLQIPRTQSSFLLESWNQVGRLKDFGAPLVFDNRNYPRETLLTNKLPKGKPLVVLAIDGTSSPFQHRDELVADITKHVGDKAHVVDLKDYRSEYFHDFLGIFDMAAVLVSIDSGFGQLACASKVPVVALTASNKPGTTWYTSPARPQHICRVPYNQYQARKAEVLEAIGNCVGVYSKPCIRHAWTGTLMSGDTQRRHTLARLTWQTEAKSYGAWHDVRVTDEHVTRDARSVGDTIQLPFIHDMVEMASKDAKDEDIIMLTNADICLAQGLAQSIAMRCARDGSTFCHRWDFQKLESVLPNESIATGQWYIGADLFAFTVKWWNENKGNLPPFIIGRECWDWAFRELVKQTGGSEIKEGIYHEKHASPWEMNRSLKGNLHNRSHCRAFLKAANIPLAEIENEPYFEV